MESLNKKTVPKLIAATDNETVKRVLELRGELAKASVKKYGAIDRAVNKDNRLRGTMLFYGARTGRWAGRIFQPQNLPQNKLEDLALARSSYAGRRTRRQCLFGNIWDPFAAGPQALIPSPPLHGGRLFSHRGRVIAWFAREKWRMDVFATHGKIYEASASQMFHVPLDSIAKGQANYALRQKGKVAGAGPRVRRSEGRAAGHGRPRHGPRRRRATKAGQGLAESQPINHEVLVGRRGRPEADREPGNPRSDIRVQARLPLHPAAKRAQAGVREAKDNTDRQRRSGPAGLRRHGPDPKNLGDR